MRAAPAPRVQKEESRSRVQKEESRCYHLNLQQPFGQYRSAESLHGDCEADLIRNSTV